MYVRPISTFLSRGRSIPAIRAMPRLPLTLFVLRVALTDDACHTVPLDNLAMLADRLHAAADFHRRSRKKFPVKSYRITCCVVTCKGAATAAPTPGTGQTGR